MTQNNRLDKRLIAHIGSAKPTLVEFYRGERAENPETITRLQGEYGDKAYVMTIDGAESQDLMATYKVATYPTFILFKDGQEVWRDGGQKSYGELSDMIRRFI